MRLRRGAAVGQGALRPTEPGQRVGLRLGGACGCAWAQRGAALGRSMAPSRGQSDAVQMRGMRPQRGAAWSWARAKRRRKGRSVGLCMTRRGAVHGRSVGLRKGRSVWPRRRAACSRAGAKHAAALERSMRLPWGPAWGSAGALRGAAHGAAWNCARGAPRSSGGVPHVAALDRRMQMG